MTPPGRGLGGASGHPAGSAEVVSAAGPVGSNDQHPRQLVTGCGLSTLAASVFPEGEY
jgi:hypothetical protein